MTKNNFDEMADKIKKIVSENMCVNVYDISPSSRLIEDLGADSLDIIDTEIKIEETFDFDFDDSFAPITVADLVTGAKTCLMKKREEGNENGE